MNTTVITGIGVILPNTFNVESFWENLSCGKSQLDFIPEFENHRTKVAAQIKEFNSKDYLKNLKPDFSNKYTKEIKIVMSAVEEARKDAGIIHGLDVDPQRIGFIESSSRGSLSWWYETIKKNKSLDEAVLASLPDTCATMAAIYSNIQGIVTTLSNSCVGGHHALSIALNELQSDKADLFYVGGHDFPIIPPLLEIYSSPKSRVLTSENINPKNAIKPYDLNRDGFAFGEGCVVLCLERKDKAIQRGARIYCEILTHLGMNEVAHATTMDLTGKKTADLIYRSLQQSFRSINEVDYVCGHGTATVYNDLAETRALNTLYENNKRPPLGSNKPIFGHCLGAAGIINIAASSLMIYNQALCPTINLLHPDPECDHDHVSEGLRSTNVNTIVSITFGIGSQTSVVVLGSVQ